ncbi:MAG: TonB-dependent siderophore receptor [Rhizobiales bacterium]|nr:TonB-dependent siderophore receptor [Hyphomicrobiales bacterium]
MLVAKFVRAQHIGFAALLIIASPTQSSHAEEAQQAAPDSNQVTLPPVSVQPARPKQKRAPRVAAKKAARRPPPPPTTQPAEPPRPVETATGPVQGYVATRSAGGTKTDTPLIETPQSISVVTADQMQAQGVRTLAESLRYTPGVSAEVWGPDPRCDGLHIRGFKATGNTLFYKDSLQLKGTSFSSFNCLEPYGAERIEVVRGPSSVLFGQGEPSGIINYVSKRPLDRPFHEVEVGFGSFKQLEGRFDFSGPLDKDGHWFYRLTGLGSGGGTQVDFVDKDRVFIAPALTWRPNADTTLTILSHYQRERNGWSAQFLPAEGTVFPNPHGKIPSNRFPGEPGFDRYNPTHYSIGYVFEHRASDIWTFRQNARYAGLDNPNQRVVYGVGFTEPGSNPPSSDLRTYYRYGDLGNSKLNAFAIDNQAQAKFRTGPLAHTLLIGLDHQRYKLADFGQTYEGTGPEGSAPIDIFNPVYGQPLVPGAPYYDVNQTQTQTGIYIQDQIKLDRWVFQLGGRHDWAKTRTDDRLPQGTSSSQSDTAFTGRVGLLYLFDSGWAPYVSYATSFLPLLGTSFAGTPFKPETGEQYEIGVKYQPPGWNAFITVAAFDLTRQNVLTNDPDHDFFQIQTGEIRSRGIEVEAVASLTSGWDLRAAYTYLEPKITADTDLTIVGKTPNGIPRHSAAVWADYTFRGGPLDGFGAGAGVRYIGSNFGSDTNVAELSGGRIVPFRIPSVTLFDAAIHYDWRGFRFAVNAKNLFDKEYVATCYNVENNCFFGSRRTVIASARYRW